MSADERAPRYRLGPRSTRGLIAGWSTGQIICVGVGLVLAVGIMRSVGGGTGFVLAIFATSAGIAAGLWPVAGRTAEEWAPTVVSYATRSLAEGGHRPWQMRRQPKGPLTHLSLVALDDLAGADGAPGKPGPPSLPPEERIADRSAGLNLASPGVIIDAQGGSSTLVLPVGGSGFALLDERERCERIAEWAGALAALARESAGLHRLQWVFDTYPVWLEGPLGAGGSGPAGEDYGRLLTEALPSLWQREILVALSIRRGAGLRQTQTASAATLRSHLALVTERLSAAGLVPGPALTTAQLARRLERSFRAEPASGLTCWPWPVGVENGWATLRTDATWHASYWVAEWPRSEVHGGFLLPLLFLTGVRCTVAMTMAPLPPLTAVRRAERERTEGRADVELRQKHGFAITARAHREQEGRQQREAELADGHAAYRFSGYVTVTDSSREGLEEACRRVEQAAALAQLDLRRLYGAQEEGFVATLPVGRGCR